MNYFKYMRSSTNYYFRDNIEMNAGFNKPTNSYRETMRNNILF